MNTTTLRTIAHDAIRRTSDHDYANMVEDIADAADDGLIDITQCADVGEALGVYARFLLASHDPARYSTLADGPTFRDYRSETEQ